MRRVASDFAKIWTTVSEEEWVTLKETGCISSGKYESDGDWRDQWLSSQLQKRTEGYKGNTPYWGYFDPVFPSVTAGKLITDRFEYYKTTLVVLNLIMPFNRVLLFPDLFWVNVFNRVYVGLNREETDLYHEKVDQHSYYSSETLPAEYVAEIHQSWDAVFDRGFSRRHHKKGLMEAVIGDIRLPDVDTAIRLTPEFFKYPEYMPTRWSD